MLKQLRDQTFFLRKDDGQKGERKNVEARQQSRKV